MSSPNECRVLIVNQHGDNRGDEAALDAMLHGIETRFPNAEFTVIHQFQNDTSAREMRPEVQWISLRLSPLEGARLVIYLAFRVLGLRPRFLLGHVGKETIRAYERADIVISAPGGPYFGDLYINHEPVHWLYVWMGALHRTPCFLYATSAGPFKKKWANPFRRFTYRRFESIFVREEISASYVRGLFGDRKRNVDVHVSVDSALQVAVSARARDTQRNLIVVSAINWHYNGAANVAERRERYDQSIADAINVLTQDLPSDVIFVPQLHGTQHRDSPYLSHLAEVTKKCVAPKDVTVTVLDETTNMRTQRSLFASADWVIAGRYHPAVFALSAGIPQICIAYEHKALGLLTLAGLDDVVLDIQEVTGEALLAKAHHLISHREDIALRSRNAASSLMKMSESTSLSVADILEKACRDQK